MGRTQRRRWHRNFRDGANGSALPPNGKYFYPDLFMLLGRQGWKNEAGLQIRVFQNAMRGVCSKKRKMRVGSELIRLPLKCLITIKTLEDDAAFRSLFEPKKFKQTLAMPFQSLLAVYLLYQLHLGESSPLVAYIRGLPTHFDTPYFCPMNELNWLPDEVLERTVWQNRRIRDSYLHLKEVVAHKFCPCCGRELINDIFSLNLMKWAYFVVNTRSVFVKSEDFKPAKCFFQPLISDTSNMALAPFLDFFNHTDNVRTTAELVRSEGAANFEYVLTLVSTATKVKPYHQIFISYGPLPNLALLTEYGFMLTFNVHDYFEVRLADIENMIKTEPCYKGRIFHRNKFRFIRDHNLDKEMFLHIHEGHSHNLHVVFHLIFKEESPYLNVYNEVAFGAPERLQNITDDLAHFIDFKISEYERLLDGMDGMQKVSSNGMMVHGYSRECVRYLEDYSSNFCKPEAVY